jgi:hypothetical protein
MNDTVEQVADAEPVVLQPMESKRAAGPHVDVSVDLESLGLEQDAMILSIGAVKFNRHTGELGEQFYRVIDIANPLGGGTMSASTVLWWMNQAAEVRDVVFSKDPAYASVRVDLRQALVEFSEFLGFDETLDEGQFPNVTLWQRGNKDGQWLESAYLGMQLKVPYQYWQLSDQRTLTSVFNDVVPKNPDHAHDALSDAVWQAKCLVGIFARLYSMGALLPPVPAGHVVSEHVSSDDSTVDAQAYVGLET